MKHPEDQINERLQNALRDRFKSIHDEPDPALSKIILGSINRRSRFTKPVRLALVAFLTIFISIAVHDQKLPSELRAAMDMPVGMSIDKASPHAEDHGLKNQINDPVKESIHPKPERTRINAAVSGPEIAEKDSSNAISFQPFENKQISWEVMSLDNIPFRPYNSIQLPDIYKVERKSTPASSENHWNILLGFIPMNTFQVVRINPQQQARYQNFSFPANFTRKKTAYKFQAGIENSGFQLLFNYSLLRQTVDYEVATPEFVLDNQGNPVRKGLPKELNATLHFVGAGLRKNFTLNRIGLRNYFINTGLDFSKELSSKQNAFWGTVAVGREIRLNGNTSIVAGPYLEYSLNKLGAGDAGFQIQPYQIGFSFNLKYKINQRN